VNTSAEIVQGLLGVILIGVGAKCLRTQQALRLLKEHLLKPSRWVGVALAILAMLWGLESFLGLGTWGEVFTFLPPLVRTLQCLLILAIASGIFVDMALNRLEEERDQYRESEEKYLRFVRKVIDSLDAQIMVVDPDYRIRLANAKLLEDLGVDEVELVGEHCHEILHRECNQTDDCREDSDDHQCPWRAVRRKAEPVSMTHRHRMRDGQERIMELMAFPIFGDTGEIAYLVETLWDVTERKRLEEKAMEKERLEGVVEMATAVAHELNTPLFTVLGNAQLMLRGMTPDHPLRRDVETILTECKRMRELTQRMTRINRYSVKDYVGDIRLVDIEGASEMLHHAEKMAALGQLTAAVAHEIANPLYLILGHAQLLVREYQPDDQVKTDLKQIEKSARICRGIVMNLLKVARKGEEDVEGEDLNERLSDILGLLEHAYALDGVTIERDFASDIPPVSARHDQLAQVYLNLLNNAFQSIEGGGTIHVRTRFDLDSAEALIQVEDTGRGIPEAIRSRIFEPFFTTKGAGKGTGLGLSVSNEIVRRHQGRISVESEEGQGSCFTVHIPIGSEKTVSSRPEHRATP
jgi:PAS domain S-box-containing protein